LLRAPDAATLAPTHPARPKIEAAPKQGAAFICVGETCSLPVTEPGRLAEATA
jgi:hypothetical protein